MVFAQPANIACMKKWSQERLDQHLAHAAWYKPIRKVRARRLDKDAQWRTSTGSVLHAKAGDWEVTDGTRTWTVASGVFDRSYSQVAPGEYRKTGRVQARRLSEDATIPTLEGEAHAHAGDWVVRGVTGECWPVPDAEFSDAYEILEMP